MHPPRREGARAALRQRVPAVGAAGALDSGDGGPEFGDLPAEHVDRRRAIEVGGHPDHLQGRSRHHGVRLVGPALEEVWRADDEHPLDRTEPPGIEAGALQRRGRGREVLRRERRCDRERHGRLTGPHLGEELGVLAHGQELEPRLDQRCLPPVGLAGELGEEHLVLRVVGVVERGELLADEGGE